MRSMVAVLLLGILSVWGVAQELLLVEDLGYQAKQFNPGDEGVVQRIKLRDHDTNQDPVIFTKLRVENRGTATAQDLVWVKVFLRVGNAKILLAEANSFPIHAYLRGPVEERSLPDDSLGYIEVMIKTSEDPTHGHTLQPELTLWYSEDKEGESTTLLDGSPDRLNVEVFSAEILPGPQGGNLNPKDEFVVAEIEFKDDPDVNFENLYLEGITIHGPGHPTVEKWIIDNGISRVESSSPSAFSLPKRYLLALDEGEHVLKVIAVVGEKPRDGEEIKPTVTVTVREGGNIKVFTLLDPVADVVRYAGFEEIENRELLQAGQILERKPQELVHSFVVLKDRDRNATAPTVLFLELEPLGTARQLEYLEIWDGRGNLLGVAESWGTVKLSRPDGGPLRVADDGSLSLKLVLGIGDELPLGASLLLRKSLAVEEIDYGWNRPTHFADTQTVTDINPAFFGKPTIRLEAKAGAVRVVTDGETVERLEGTLTYDVPEPLHTLVVATADGDPLSHEAIQEAVDVLEARLLSMGIPVRSLRAVGEGWLELRVPAEVKAEVIQGLVELQGRLAIHRVLATSLDRAELEAALEPGQRTLPSHAYDAAGKPAEWYLVGPALLSGPIAASAEVRETPTGLYEVVLRLTQEASQTLAQAVAELRAEGESPGEPGDRFALSVDGEVYSTLVVTGELKRQAVESGAIPTVVFTAPLSPEEASVLPCVLGGRALPADLAVLARYTPQTLDVSLQGTTAYRIARSRVTPGSISFAVTSKENLTAGPLFEAAFVYRVELEGTLPKGVEIPAVALQVTLSVAAFADTAGIDLPYTLAPGSVDLILVPTVVQR